jgi:hypothetical protein
MSIRANTGASKALAKALPSRQKMKNINALSGKNAERTFNLASSSLRQDFRANIIKQNGTVFCSIVLGLHSPLQGGD